MSYILYLTDPDVEWQREWGGTLRLFPTTKSRTSVGKTLNVPTNDPAQFLRIGWNKLAMFAVRPGASFHDVEEVYRADDPAQDLQRVRMAISGWYHIPQEGEDGYRPGELREHEHEAGRAQLKTVDEFDRPQPKPSFYPRYEEEKWHPPRQSRKTLTEEDCGFLLRFINPRLLTPDAVDDMQNEFEDESVLRLDDFLAPKFAERLLEWLSAQPTTLSSSTRLAEDQGWQVAQPSHKQKYLYHTASNDATASNGSSGANAPPMPLQEITTELIPSDPFRKRLGHDPSTAMQSHEARGRRFRRGSETRLEMTLGITPGGRWEDSDDEDGSDADDDGAVLERKKSNKSTAVNTKSREARVKTVNGLFSYLLDQDRAETNCGGYEVWMAGDDDNENEAEDEGHGSSSEASNAGPSSKPKFKPQKLESDPAVYQASSDPSCDSGVAFSMAAGFNQLSLVLRDKGLLRFVKYVSASAGCDRWDVAAEFGVDWPRTEYEIEMTKEEAAGGESQDEDGSERREIQD